jgi:hypothetical protein
MAFRHVAEAPRCRLEQKRVVCVKALNILLLLHAVGSCVPSTICHHIHALWVFEFQSNPTY